MDSAPDPSQGSLDELLGKATRVKLLDGGMSQGKALGKKVLVKTSDPQSLAVLGECLEIIEEQDSFGHCMCLGDYTFQFFDGRRVIAMIGLHHGRSIRWEEAWKYDALLKDGPRLLTWLAEQGAAAPLKAFQEDQKRAEESRQATLRWQEAMPACLRPYWDQMQDLSFGMVTFTPDSQKGEGHPGQKKASTSGLTPLLDALEGEYPDLDTRLLALFHWFGSGKGPWSGYPSYEGAADRLLLEFPTSQLVTALTNHPLTPTHLEGAARYFAGYHFRTNKPNDARQLPSELKKKLKKHSRATSDKDKKKRARHAF